MKIALPSGRWVTIDGRPPEATGREPPDEPPRAALFSEVARATARGDVVVEDERGEAIDLGGLPLGDFHALRAILTRKGWLAEEEISIPCRNCAEELVCRPCARLALGPFVDGELRDDELDATAPFGEPRAIPRVRLVGGGEAREVILEGRTLAQATPLHEALARPRLRLTASVVRAMGIVALGAERRPDRIARALETASEEAWQAVGDRFLEAHYAPRLFAVVPCPACGARNDVDAPYERELEPSSYAHSREMERESNAEPFPTFDEFAAEARAVAGRMLAERGADDVALIVEGGVAACDDGGEPLLGAYVPGHPGDAGSPSRQPEITAYYRTFRAMHDEEGPYDWRAELAETLEHELDHHVAALTGDDPVDDEERREIAREAERVHGKKALARAELSAFGRDATGFLARTWPIWLILLLAILATTIAEVR